MAGLGPACAPLPADEALVARIERPGWLIRDRQPEHDLPRHSPPSNYVEDKKRHDQSHRLERAAVNSRTRDVLAGMLPVSLIRSRPFLAGRGELLFRKPLLFGNLALHPKSVSWRSTNVGQIAVIMRYGEETRGFAGAPDG
jgi:hypothetical protein